MMFALLFGGVLACAFNAAIVTRSVSRALRQGVWLGFRKAPAKRTEHPGRFWGWTAVNLSIVGLHVAALSYLIWVATGLLRNSN